MMMCDMSAMTFGTGLLCLLLLAALLLIAAGAVKYLFFDKRGKEDDGLRAACSPCSPA